MTEDLIQKYIEDKSRGRSEFEINVLSAQIPKKITENEISWSNTLQDFRAQISDLHNVHLTNGNFEEFRALVKDMSKEIKSVQNEYKILMKSHKEIIELNNAFEILDLVRLEKRLEDSLSSIKKARIDLECSLSKSDPGFKHIQVCQKLIILNSNSEDNGFLQPAPVD